MLFKYKGINKSGRIERGYVNAFSNKEALSIIKDEKGIVFIESISVVRNSYRLNKVRETIDNQLTTIENNAKDKRYERQKQRILKEREKKGINLSKGAKSKSKPQPGKSSGPSSGKKEHTPSFINSLRSISLTDDISNIMSKMSGGTTERFDESFEDFNFQVGQESHINELAGIHYMHDDEAKEKILNEFNNPELDWDAIEESEMDVEVREDKGKKYKIKRKEIILFTRRLQIMINSGVSLLKGLLILKDDENEDLSEMVGNIIENMEQGNMFSQSIADYPKHFDYTYVALVSVGESSGSLAEALADILEIMEQKDEVNKKLRTAAIYPSVIGVVLLVMMTFASIFFMPTFRDLFSDAGVEMPALTKFVFLVSDYFPYIVGVIALIIITFILLRKSNKSFDKYMTKKIDALLLKMPVIKDVLTVNYMFNFSSTIALMLKNGIKLEDTLALTSKTINNVYIKNEIANVSALMLQGFTFSEALRHQEHFDSILTNIVLTGEESGKLSYALTEIADYYRKDLDRKITNLMELVQPVSMIIIGLIVGPIIVAIYLPIIDMSSGALM